MLLDEDGRADDQYRPDPDHAKEYWMLSDIFASAAGEVDGQGIVDVNAGEHVGRRVSGIKSTYEHCADIRSLQVNRTKVQSVGPDVGQHEKNRHPRYHIESETVVFVDIFIDQDKKQKSDQHEQKPAEIGDDEDLAEGDQIIQRAVDRVKSSGRKASVLQVFKEQKINDGVDRQDPSLLLIFKCVSKQIHSRLSIFMFRVTSVASCIDTL